MITQDKALHTYLLGCLDFQTVLSLQRRLVYEVSGGDSPYLLICEHPTTITIGRHGSRFDLFLDEEEIQLRNWPVYWVNRGGGNWLHVPGQLAIYPIFPIQRMGMMLHDYLQCLETVLLQVCTCLQIPSVFSVTDTALLAGRRPIACWGVSVRQWITYYGAILNVNPTLDGFRQVRSDKDHLPMTSLVRESRRLIRMTHIRESLITAFVEQFDFARYHLFFDHPFLVKEVPAYAISPSH